MNRDPNERAQPDGATPDEFEAIVAAWRREGDVPEWPDDADRANEFLETDPQQPVGTSGPASAEQAPFLDEEHFVPPEPPPLPRIGPPALVGLALLAVGFVLVLAPGWLGVADPYGLPLGLVVLAAGLGWLVLRLWPDPPDRGTGGDDDGAIL